MGEVVDELYREHAAQLTAALALSTGDLAAAEDLCHETFVRALLAVDRLQAHPDPRGWLFRTGYNLARNHLRLLLRHRHAASARYPVYAYEDWAGLADLKEALRRLSRRQRDAVVLHDYMGFTAGEVATILGCAEGSAKSHLRRGRAALDEMLDVREGTR
jgi:RNA polymerase sigma factor (sigma-70 family)